MKHLTIIMLAIAGLLTAEPVIAQAQGSEEAADYALSWAAARGSYGEFPRASYARYGYGHSHRRYRH
jgi:hypothetical protein